MTGVPISITGVGQQFPFGDSARRAAAQKILASFNTWAFKREQPSSVDALERVIGAAIGERRSLSFVLYWGKGPREDAAMPEFACLDYLARLASRAAAVHTPGARFDLIFTDTHAELNGHPRISFERYFESVAVAARGHAFGCFRLSDVVRKAGPVAFDPSEIDDERVCRLMRSASRWFRGGGSLEDGARRYLLANMIERRAMDAVFPGSIFATFNGSDCDFLFPQRMPKFYMYSLRKGCSVKPWFMDADGRPLLSAG